MNNDNLNKLRKQCKQLGIKYTNIDNEDSLLKKINAFVNKSETLEDRMNESRDLMNSIDDSNELVRCRVTCNNPDKKHLSGEIIAIGNDKIGEIRKFIQFDVPYHVPKIIFKYLCEKEFADIYPGPTKRPEYKFKKEYNVTVLPDMTEKEFNAIRNKQLLEKNNEEYSEQGKPL